MKTLLALISLAIFWTVTLGAPQLGKKESIVSCVAINKSTACIAPLRYMDTDTVIKGEYIIVFKKNAENFECKYPLVSSVCHYKLYNTIMFH